MSQVESLLLSTASCPILIGDDKRGGQSTREKSAPTGKEGKKQPLVPPLGRAPSNPRENAESVLWFVAVAGFFLTGRTHTVLFNMPSNPLKPTSTTQRWEQTSKASCWCKGHFGSGMCASWGLVRAPLAAGTCTNVSTLLRCQQSTGQLLLLLGASRDWGVHPHASNL